MTDSPEPSAQRESKLDCPTPIEWEQLLSPTAILKETDHRLDSHVEHCPTCRRYLEKRLSSPGQALVSIACSLDEPIAARPLNLKGINVPRGYQAIGEPVYGGRGLVFKAFHAEAGRFVAIKMSKNRHGANETELKALQNEASAVSSLSHPNIVQVYEVLLDNDPPAIVMEWVDGGTLLDRLKTIQPNNAEIVTLMKQLADSVGHAHQRMVLHRDIKPSNILMSGERFSGAKLSDFGLAKLGQPEGGWSTATEFIGTPVYMAPESFRKVIGAIGPTVDIYSLGAIFYRLLTGKVPFEGANPIELGMRVVQEEVTPIRQFQKNVPKELETICLKCLRKEPQERYQDADSLKADLVRYEEGKPIKARCDDALARWRRWARRDPKAARQASAFAGFLICVILALGAMLRSSIRSEQRAIENQDLASRNAIQAEQRLSESIKAMSLASPIFKRILNDFKLNQDEIRNIVIFATLRENLEIEPEDLKQRLKHHYLTLELADSLRKISGYETKSIELAKLARKKIGRLIREHGDEAAKIVYASDPTGEYVETLLEKALIQYGNACSQLFGTYPRVKQIGFSDTLPAEDPNQELIHEAIASAERALTLNPLLDDAKGNIADYNIALADREFAEGRRDGAIIYSRKALQISESLKETYWEYKDRWYTTAWHRGYLAQLYLEPPFDLETFLDTIKPLEDALSSDRIKNHPHKMELSVMLWQKSLCKYQPQVAVGKFQNAMSTIDKLIHTIPMKNGNKINEQIIGHQFNLLNLERLCLLKLMDTDTKIIEAEEKKVELQIEKIANQDEMFMARAYFQLFRPSVHKRNPKAALATLEQMNKELTEVPILTNICMILTRENALGSVVQQPLSAGRYRSKGGLIPLMSIVFESENLLRYEKRQESAAQLKLVDDWLENDKMIPCMILLRVKEIKAGLNSTK